MTASADWGDAVRRVHAEANGLIEMAIVTQEELPDLVFAALTGDADAMALAEQVNRVLHNIQAATGKKAKLCLTCPRRLRGGRYAVIIAKPACDNPVEAISGGICTACAAGHDAVQAKAFQGLRKLWPDLRPIARPHSTPGHA